MHGEAVLQEFIVCIVSKVLYSKCLILRLMEKGPRDRTKGMTLRNEAAYDNWIIVILP